MQWFEMLRAGPNRYVEVLRYSLITMNSPAIRAGRTPGTRDLHVVYGWCMSRVRTNIEIEDTDVRAIMDRFGVRTKTEAVALARLDGSGAEQLRDA